MLRKQNHDPHSPKVRIILSTKIAETALTIDNVVYVLDSGKEREYYYDELARLDYVVTKDISLSSCIQRSGRAGRVKPGYCYKMYTQAQEEKFEPQREMEILRTDIKDVILYTHKLKKYFQFRDILGNNLINKKDPKLAMKVTRELFKLGALRKVQKIINDEITENAIVDNSSQGTMDTKSRATSVTGELQSLKNPDGGNEIMYRDEIELTKKGNFMIHISLKTMNAALLWECMRLNISELGLIASSTLKKSRGFFRKNVFFHF